MTTPTSLPAWRKRVQQRLRDLDNRIAALGATTPDVSRGVPTGVMHPFYGAVAPSGYLLCNGATYAVADYPVLASQLGVSSGDTFTVPDMRDRFPIGVSGTKALGSAGGSATKTLTVANLPPHDHNLRISTAAGAVNKAVAVASGTYVEDNPDPIQNTGSGTAFDVMPPWRAVNFIIKT